MQGLSGTPAAKGRLDCSTGGKLRSERSGGNKDWRRSEGGGVGGVVDVRGKVAERMSCCTGGGLKRGGWEDQVQRPYVVESPSLPPQRSSVKVPFQSF